MLLKCMKNKHFLQLFFVLSGIALVIYMLHLYKEDDLFMLPDIEDGNHKLPRSGASILFHETTSAYNQMSPSLNPRQACAIESAAKLNTEWDVFVLFATSSDRYNVSHNREALDALLEYPNINFRKIDLESYAKDTLIYDWIREGNLYKSKYVIEHTSDYLRFLSLYKWSGVYLDLDVIMQQPFSGIPSNYACAQRMDSIGAGLINLDDLQNGRLYANLFLENFKKNFDGNIWGKNGPDVMTRVLSAQCHTKSVKSMMNKKCHGFRLFPPSFCYAIGYHYWETFFNPDYTQIVLDAVKHSIGIHVWNKFSKSTVLHKGDGSAYDLLARMYCPVVYSKTGKDW